MRNVLNSLVLIFISASFSLAGQKMDLKVFDSQPVWEIPLLKSKGSCFCEFSQDGKLLWVIHGESRTNCYRIADRRMIPPGDFATASQPLSRLSWRKKFHDLTNWKLTVENKKGLKLPPDISSRGKAAVCHFQFSPTGMPTCVDVSYWEDHHPCGIVFRTDFERCFCERVYTVGNAFMVWFFFSEDGRRCCVDKMHTMDPKSKRCLVFCESERTQLDDEDFEKGHKIFWSELEAMTGDSLVSVDTEFISNTKIAITATSCGRYSFFGRTYVLIYDFNLRRVAWARKTRNEFSKRSGWPTPILSVDEHYLAVELSKWIYVYEFPVSDYCSGHR